MNLLLDTHVALWAIADDKSCLVVQLSVDNKTNRAYIPHIAHIWSLNYVSITFLCPR